MKNGSGTIHADDHENGDDGGDEESLLRGALRLKFMNPRMTMPPASRRRQAILPF